MAMRCVLILKGNGKGEGVHHFTALTKTDAIEKSESLIAQVTGGSRVERQEFPFTGKPQSETPKAQLLRELCQWEDAE